jgi:hypothetical protein
MRSATAVLDAPVILQHDLAIEELREPFLMITDTRSREVVTIIEILSPSNKGRDRDQYLAKRNRILRSPTHLVEIDLLRSGERMPELDPRKDIDYAIMVSQSDLRPSAGFWLIRLREPLPQFSIPLHGTDSVTVELKPLIEAIHDAAHYQEEIYSDPITPPLSAEDAPWAAGLLAAAKIDAKV